MKIIDYGSLLIRYETLKQEDKKHLRKLRRLEIENKTIKQCLLNEEKRTKTFRDAYRKQLNEYENLANDYEKSEKQVKSLERKLKKYE